MANPLRLEVLLGAVDKATAPLNRVSQSSKAAAARLKELTEQQRQVNRIQKDVEGYNKTREALKANDTALAKINASLKSHKEKLSAAREAQRSARREVKSAERDYNELSAKLLTTRGSNQALNTELEKARVRLESVRGSANKAAAESDKFARKVRSAEGEEKRLSGSTARLSRDVGIYSDKLKAANVNTGALSTVAFKLKRREDALTESITKQRSQLDRLGQKQEQVNKARERYRHGMSVSNSLAVAGATGMGIGYGTYRIFHNPLDEYKNYQNEVERVDALGKGPATTKAAVQYAHTNRAYGVSELESLTLLRDAISIFGDLGHAEGVTPMMQRMWFANKARYGEEGAEERLRQFEDMIKAVELRGGVSNPEQFGIQANMIQKIINATGNRVNPSEWMQFIKTGQLAVKGMDNDAFYYKSEPLIQELGGFKVGTAFQSAYQNLYQGKTTKVAANRLMELGLVGDKSKVSFDSVGQNGYIGPGALLKGRLFNSDPIEWIRTVLLPQLAKHGITDDAQIQDAIGQIMTNRTGAGLYANVVQQIKNGSIDRRIDLNAHADGIDDMHRKAVNQTQGKELELAARRADLYRQMGSEIMPLYTKALEKIAGALRDVTDWMEKNPKKAKVMLATLASVGALAASFGILSLAAAAISRPVIIAIYLLRRMGIATRGAGKGGRALGRGLQWLKKPLGLVIKGVRWLPTGLTLVSKSLWLVARAAIGLAVANPVIAAIVVAVAALGAAAYLIYKNWGAISQFFKDRWQDVKDAFHGGIGKVSELLVNWSPQGLVYKGISELLGYLGIDVPGNLFDAGKAMINGLWDGMKAMWEKVAGWFDGIGNWIKEKMPFSGHWEVTPPQVPINQDAPWAKQNPWMAGESNKPSKLSTERQGAMKVAARAAMWTGAAMPAFAGAALPSIDDPSSIIQMDTRPPVSAPAAAPANHDNRQYSINIHAAPGMDSHAIARHVSDEIDRRDRQKRARERSSMSDRR
ncbi:hypothetical protein [Carnimonas bestiolae]|uniref:hypothetical protein n=1 Tax=Carnimonas bestiolae TaxID=3402172 RepID=UPI003EDB7AFF